MALNNYIEDDWDDNSLTGRTGAEKDVFYQYSTGGTGDLLKGVYRPRWEVESGYVEANNSQLEVPPGDTTTQNVTTTSEMSVGSWSLSWVFETVISSGGVRINFMPGELLGSNLVPNNSIFIDINNFESNYDLIKRISGTNTRVITSTWPVDTNNHSSKVTRDSYGGAELFFDGTSQGTTTEAEDIDVNYFNVNSSSDAVFNADSLVVQ